MIILETVIFLFISSLSVLSLNGYGKIIAPRYKKNFLEEIFFGFIVVAFIVTFLHFFININYIISLSILFFGLIYFVKTNKENLLKINYINWIVFFILIPIFLSQKYHEDFGYYHLPYILLMVEQKIIFGLANSNIAFSHNSIWLNRAASRMDEKNCSDDPLFVTLVERLHALEPSAASAYYLGLLNDKKGDTNLAIQY